MHHQRTIKCDKEKKHREEQFSIEDDIKKINKSSFFESDNDEEEQPIIQEPPKMVKISSEPNLEPIQQMELYEKQLKAALTVENPDIPKALGILDLIDKVTITALLLKKCQTLVTTIKKIRRYKSSQKIMDKSNQVYHRFKLVFTGLENGASVTAAQVKGDKENSAKLTS